MLASDEAATAQSRLANHRIAIVSNVVTQSGDGIGDHTRLKQERLSALGFAVTVFGRRRGQWYSRKASTESFAPSPMPGGNWDTVLVEYNPFMFGRWGFAPWLPRYLWRLRRQHPRPRLMILVHEPFVRMTDPRTALMGPWQRIQLWCTVAACDTRLASIDRWADLLTGWFPKHRADAFPIPSNMPNMRHQREEVRRDLGLQPADILMATFGSDHPSQLDRPVRLAFERVTQAKGGQAYLLLLGSPARLKAVHEADPKVLAPGQLSAQRVGELLAAADLFLAPLIDGVSTRRTTVMAALQHEVAVVTTDGPLTSAAFRRSPETVRLVPVGDPERFATAAENLALDDEGRRELGRAGRHLYETSFDWDRATTRLVDHLA